MRAVVDWLESAFRALPLPLLEVWGRFGYFVGLVLALCAFGGLTFRSGERWGVGLQRQAWDAKAFASVPLTFLLVVISGYFGSFIVLVPGAQTLESLKDLIVFLCITLFGYPALVTVPFAYGLSDLVEGVPPAFLLDWLPGYFINPACFWVAHELIGRNPDFRRARTWGGYLVFVVIFMSIEPVLWGYICSDKFTSAISYRRITPALAFTTGMTWLVAPLAMLAALPLARSFGLFWPEIPGHVRTRRIGGTTWTWQSGAHGRPHDPDAGQGVTLRMLILAPFIVLVLVMVGATAYVTLRSAQDDARKLAIELHQGLAEHIALRLDALPIRARGAETKALDVALARAFARPPLASYGRALILDRRNGRLVASSVASDDPITKQAIEQIARRAKLGLEGELAFDHVTADPPSRETWLAYAKRYQRGAGVDWVVVTVIPEAFYLAGVRTGSSRFAVVYALALLLSLGVAAVLASVVTAPLRRMSNATRVLAGGDLSQRVDGTRIEELGALAASFNRMAEQLQASFNRVQLAVQAGNLGVWDWNIERDELIWDASMYRLYGQDPQAFSGAYDAWLKCVVEEDFERAQADVQASLRGEGDFQSEFRVRWPDGTIRFIRGAGRPMRDAQGKAIRLVGINWDVTEQLEAERELRRHRDDLEELVEQRTVDLLEAKDQADAASRAKSAFLASMSHEIRTPMNAILGFGQLIGDDPALTERNRGHVARIIASGAHLLQLMEDVLQTSKLEAGRVMLNRTRFDLHESVAAVAAMVGYRAEEQRLVLSVEGIEALPRYIRTDAPKLRQILLNLLGNAVKFTKQGRVALRAHAQLAGQSVRLCFEVEDTGPGIAEEELDKVFEPFEQTRSGIESQTGTGLGMPISRAFARLMGGDLRVRSAVGRGTTFELEIVAELESEAETASAPSEQPAQVIGRQSRPALTPKDLDALDPRVVSALREAIEVGDIYRVPELLAGVPLEQAELAAALARLADEMQLSVLLTLLQRPP